MAQRIERDKSQWHELVEYRPFYPVIKGYERLGKKYVDILGVELERAVVDNTDLVPKLFRYNNIQLDHDFQITLQQIAISFKLGLPVLVESGTSLGKTTAVEFLCALCGYEFHKVMLKGSSDTDDFMGKFVANSGVRTEYYDFNLKTMVKNDGSARFIYSPGSVSSGLIQEYGKIKVILLDEYNAAKPNVAIRMHEVLDALRKNSFIMLTEAENQVLEVDSERTKLVALQNPTGEGYQKRELLDPAQLRRWIYQRDAERLSDIAQKQVVLSTLGSKVKVERSSGALSIEETQEYPLDESQIESIPGWNLIRNQVFAFHKDMQEKLRTGKIANNQKQRFSFDDREEPARVMRFIQHFYAGDINLVTRDALRYIYKNKLQSQEDRSAVEEAIKLIEYRPPTADSKRVPLYGKPKVEAKVPLAKKSSTAESVVATSPPLLKPKTALPSSASMPLPTIPRKTMAEIEAEERAEEDKKKLNGLVDSWVEEMVIAAEVIEEYSEQIKNQGYRGTSRSDILGVLERTRKELTRYTTEGPMSRDLKKNLLTSHQQRIESAKKRIQQAIDTLSSQVDKTKPVDKKDFNF